jgi:hypothetical protein
MFPLTRSALQSSITKFNVSTLTELMDKNIYDFGIFLDLEPDDEEKAKLEENIQVALKTGGIDLEDAIDIREVKNLTLANQLLKQRRQQKQAAEQQMKLQQIQQQAQSQAEAAEKQALAETQKQQILTEQKVQFEQAKVQFDVEKYRQEAEVKIMIMNQQHKFDLELKQMEVDGLKTKEKEIEDRKDERVRIEGSQQSQLIDQRQNDLLPTSFETSATEKDQPTPSEEPMPMLNPFGMG